MSNNDFSEPHVQNVLSYNFLSHFFPFFYISFLSSICFLFLSSFHSFLSFFFLPFSFHRHKFYFSIFDSFPSFLSIGHFLRCFYFLFSFLCLVFPSNQIFSIKDIEKMCQPWQNFQTRHLIMMCWSLSVRSFLTIPNDVKIKCRCSDEDYRGFYNAVFFDRKK